LVIVELTSTSARREEHTPFSNPCALIEHACELAAAAGSYHLRTIRALIERQADRQEQFDFMSEHPLIPDLADYGHFVHTSFQKEPLP
jgi:hypothetical protein